MADQRHPPKESNGPGGPGEIVGESDGAPTGQGVSRREFVEETGKLAYVAPTLLIFSTAVMGDHTPSHPPSPAPGPGVQSVDPVDDECSQWLSPDCID